MAEQTAREALTDALKPLLPKGWKLIDTQRGTGERSRTTVQLKQLRIEPLPEAPASWLWTRFVITITTKYTDVVKAEFKLDDDVLGLVHALNKIDGLIFTEAEKVAVDDHLLGYDLTVHIASQQKE